METAMKPSLSTDQRLDEEIHKIGNVSREISACGENQNEGASISEIHAGKDERIKSLVWELNASEEIFNQTSENMKQQELHLTKAMRRLKITARKHTMRLDKRFEKTIRERDELDIFKMKLAQKLEFMRAKVQRMGEIEGFFQGQVARTIKESEDVKVNIEKSEERLMDFFSKIEAAKLHFISHMVELNRIHHPHQCHGQNKEICDQRPLFNVKQMKKEMDKLARPGSQFSEEELKLQQDQHFSRETLHLENHEDKQLPSLKIEQEKTEDAKKIQEDNMQTTTWHMKEITHFLGETVQQEKCKLENKIKMTRKEITELENKKVELKMKIIQNELIFKKGRERHKENQIKWDEKQREQKKGQIYTKKEVINKQTREKEKRLREVHGENGEFKILKSKFHHSESGNQQVSNSIDRDEDTKRMHTAIYKTKTAFRWDTKRKQKELDAVLERINIERDELEIVKKQMERCKKVVVDPKLIQMNHDTIQNLKLNSSSIEPIMEELITTMQLQSRDTHVMKGFANKLHSAFKKTKDKMMPILEMIKQNKTSTMEGTYTQLDVSLNEADIDSHRTHINKVTMEMQAWRHKLDEAVREQMQSEITEPVSNDLKRKEGQCQDIFEISLEREKIQNLNENTNTKIDAVLREIAVLEKKCVATKSQKDAFDSQGLNRGEADATKKKKNEIGNTFFIQALRKEVNYMRDDLKVKIVHFKRTMKSIAQEKEKLTSLSAEICVERHKLERERTERERHQSELKTREDELIINISTIDSLRQKVKELRKTTQEDIDRKILASDSKTKDLQIFLLALNQKMEDLQEVKKQLSLYNQKRRTENEILKAMMSDMMRQKEDMENQQLELCAVLQHVVKEKTELRQERLQLNTVREVTNRNWLDLKNTTAAIEKEMLSVQENKQMLEKKQEVLGNKLIELKSNQDQINCFLDEANQARKNTQHLNLERKSLKEKLEKAMSAFAFGQKELCVKEGNIKRDREKLEREKCFLKTEMEEVAKLKKELNEKREDIEASKIKISIEKADLSQLEMEVKTEKERLLIQRKAVEESSNDLRMREDKCMENMESIQTLRMKVRHLNEKLRELTTVNIKKCQDNTDSVIKVIHVFVEKCEAMQEQCDLLTWKTIKESLSNALSNVFSQVEQRKDISQEDGNTDVQQGQSDMYLDSDILKREKASVELVSSNIQNLQRVRGFLEDTTTVLQSKKEQAVCLMKEIEDEILISKTRSLQVKKRTEGIERVMRRFTSDHRELILGGAESQSQTRELENSTILLHALQEEMNHLRDDFKVKIVHFKRTMKSIAQEKEKLTSLSAEICVERHKLESERTERERHQSELKTREDELIINISTIDSLRQKVKELRKTTQEDIDRKIHASDSKTKDLQIFLLALNQKMEDLQEVKKQLSLYNQKRRTENEILKAMMSDMMRQKEDMENQQLELCAVLQDVVKEKTELRQERLQLNTVREVTNRNWLDLKNTTAAIEKEMLSVQKNKQMLEKKQEVLGNKLIELRSNQDQISCFLDEANQARTNTQHLNLERKSLKEKLEKAMSAFAFGQKELCVKEGNIKRDREKLEREKCFLKTEMEEVAKLKEELNEKREDIEASKIKISIEKADLSQLEMEVKTEKERLLIQRKAVEESSNDLRMREDKCMENMESIQTLRMKVRHLNEKLRELTTVNIKKCQDNTDSVIKVIHVFVEKCEAMQEQCDLLTWKTIKESLSNALSNVFSQVEQRKDISQEDGNTDVQQGQSDMYLDSDILKREKASVELVSSNIQNLQRVRGFLEDTTTVLQSKKEQAVCLMKEIEDEILISKTRSLQVKKRAEGIERVMRRFTSDHRELILGGAESQSQTRELENSTILLHALQEEMNHLRDDFKVKIVHFKRTMKSIAQEKEKLTSLSAEICVERHKLERERTERERHQSELKTREEELIINISTIDSLRQKVKELRKTTQEDIDRKIHASDSKTKDLQIFLLALNQKMEDLQEVKKQLSLYNQKRRTENEILKAMMSDMMRQKEDMENQQLELCAVLQDVVKEKTELRQERLQLNTVCEVTNRNWLDLKNTTAAIEKEMLSVQKNKQMLEKKQEVLGNKLIELRSNQDQISCFLDEANQARTNTQHLNLERKSLKEKLEKAMSAFAFGQKELCVMEGNIKRDREKLEREKCFLKTEMEEVAKLKEELNEKREDIEASKIKISIEKADLSQLEMEVKTEKERLLIQRKAVEESSNDLRMREDKCMENMESIQTLRMKVKHLNERLRELTTVNIKKCQDNTDSVIKVIHVFVEKCEAMQEQCDLLTWKTIKESLSNAWSNVFSQVEQRKDISQEDGNTDVQQGQSDMYLDSDILKREKASVELVSSNIQNLQRVRGFLEDTTTELQSKKEQAVCLMKEIEDEILISKTRSLQVKKRAEGIERVMRRFTSDHRELILGGAESQSQTRELENSTILLHALQEEMNHLRDDLKVKIVHFKRTMKSIAQEKEKLTSLSAEICVERHKLERERTERERHQSELKTREDELIINISTIDSLRQKVKELRKTTQEDIDRKIHASDSKTKDLQIFLLALNQKMEVLQEVKKQLSLYNQKRRTENEILKAMMSDMMRQKEDMENQQLELCAVLQDVVKEKTELRQERLQLNTVSEVTNRNWLDLKNTTAAIEKEMLSVQKNKQMLEKKQEVLGNKLIELRSNQDQISCFLDEANQARTNTQHLNLERKSLKEKLEKAMSAFAFGQKELCVKEGNIKRDREKLEREKCFLKTEMEEVAKLKEELNEKREDIEASKIKISIEKADLSQLEMEVKTEKERLLIQRKAVEESSNDLRMREDKCMENMESIQTLRMKVKHLNEKLRELTTVNIKKCQDNTDSVIKVIHVFVEKCEAMQEQCDLLTWKTIKESLSNALSNVFSQVEQRKDISQEDGNTDVQQGQSDMYLDSDILKREKASVELVSSNIQNLQRVRGFLEDTTTVLQSKKEQAVCLMKEIEDEILISKTRSLQVKKRTEGIERVMRRFTSDHRELILGGAESQSQTRELENSTILLHALQEEMNHLRDDLKVKIVHFKRTMKSIAQEKEKLTSLSAEICVERHKLESERTERERHQSELKTREDELIINISTIDSLRQKVKELRKTTQEDIDRKIHASDSKTKDLQIFLLALNQKMEDLQEVKKQLSLYNQKRRTENEILKAMMSDMMRQKKDMENQQLELCAVLQDVVKEKTELRQERLQLNTVREVTNRNWLDLKNTTAAIEKEMLSMQENKQMLEKNQEVLGNKLIELRSNQDQISCFLDEANQARTNTQHLNLERKSLKEKLEKAMSAFAFGQKELCVKEGNIKRDREKLEREKCFLKTEMEEVAKLKEELNEKREDIEASKIKISIEKADLSQLEMEVKTEKERLLIQRKAVEESSNDLRMREDKCMENMESIQTLRMKVKHLNEKLRELTTVNIKKCQDNTDSVIKVIHVFVEKCEAMQEQCDLLTWKTIKESLSNALSNVFSQVEQRKDISQEDGNTDVQQGQSDMYLDSDILKREKASVELVSSNIQNLQRVRGFLEDTTTVLQSKKEQAVCLMKEIEDEILISKTRSLQVKKRTEGIERVMRRFTSDHRELILGGAESQSQTRELENSTILLHALQEEMNHLRDDLKVKIVHFKRTMKSIAQEKEKLTSLSAEICVERHKLERERTERERHQSELKTREDELIINISTIDSLRQKVKELRKTTQEDIDRKIHASDSKTKDLQIFLLALNQKMEDLQEVKKQLSLYNQKRRTENEILKAMMSDMMRQKEDMENQQLELCAVLQDVVKEKTELRQERLQLNTVREVTNRNWLDLKNTTAAIEKEMLSMQENKQMLEKNQEVLGNKLIELRSNQDQISCFLDEANQARKNTQHLNLERKSLKEKLEKAMSAFAFGQKELCVKEGNIKRDREKLEREKCFLKTEMEEVAKLEEELNEKREDIEASKIKISIEKADLSQLEMEVKTEKERLLIQRKAVEESSNDLRMREDKCMENMESIQTLRMKVKHLNEKLRELTTVNIKKCQDNTDSVIKVIHVFVEKCEAMQEQCDLLTWKTIKESLSNALSNVFSQVEQRKDISQEDGNTDVQQGQSDMYLDSDILKREKASVELVSSNIQNLQRVRGFLEDTTTVLQSKKEQAVCLMKEIEDEILISKTRSLQVKKRAEGIERVMRRFTSDHRELILGGAESQSQTRELENSTILLHALQEEMNHLRDDLKVKIVHFKRTMKSIAQEKEKLTSLSAEICVERHKLERERTERERHQSELKTREDELIINISTIDSLRQKVKELRKTTQEDIDRKIHASDSKTKDLQIFLLALNQKMEDLQEVKKQLSLYNQKRRTENEILKAMMSDMMRQKEDMENQQLELCAVLQDVVKEKTELRQERLQLNTVREVTNRNWLDLKNTTAAIEKEMLSVQKNKQMLEKKQEVLGNKLIELRSNQDQISCFLDEANQARTNTQHLNLERKSLKEKLEKAMSAFAFGQKELCVKEGNIKRDREKLEREKCFLKTEMEEVAKLKEELNEKREDIEASKIKISIEKADLSQLEMEVKTEKERLLIQRKAVEESSNDLRMREDKCMENMESIQTLRMKVRHLNEKLRELTTVNIKKCQDNTDSVIKVIHVFVEKCEAMQEQCDLLTWKTIKESLSNALSNVFSQVEHRKDISQEDGNTDVQQGQSDMYLDSDILKREKASVELVSSNIQNLQRVRGFLEDTTTVLHSKKEQAVCLMKEIEDEILISKTRSLQVKKRAEGIERVMRRFTSDHRELILGGAESQSQTRELENSTILLHALQEEMNHLRDDFKVKIVHFKRTMKSIAQEKEKLTSLSAEICVERHKLERERTERERHQSELKTREEELIINISTIDSLRQKVKELRKTTQEDIDRKIHASDSKTKDLQIFLLALNQKMEDLQEVKKQLSLYNQKRRTENEILKAMMSDMMRQKEDMENQQLELCAVLQHVVKEKTELRQERLQLNTVCEVTNRNWLDLKNTTAAIEKEMLSVQENKQMLEKKQEVLGNKLIELRSNQDQISCFLDEANQARTNTQHLNLERKSLKEKLEKAMSAFAFGQKELCVKEGNIKRDREKLEREKCFLKTEMEEVAKLKKELNEKREDIEASKIKISIEKADLSQLEMEVKTEKERLLIQRKAVEESSNDLRMREDKCMENMESIQTLRMKVKHLNEKLRELTTVNIKKCQDNTDSVIKVIHVFVEKCEAMQEQCDLLTWKTIKESLSNALSNVFSQVEQRKDISQEDGNTDVQQGQSDMYLDSDILKREKASVELVSSNIQNLQRVRGFLEDTTTVLHSKKEQAVCLMKEIEDEILISKTRSLQVKKRAEGIERVMRRFTSDHRELILGGAESQSQTRELENSTILLHALQEEMNHLRDDLKVKIVHFKRTMKSIAQEKEKLTSLSAEICVERHKLERERTERERHQSELKTREDELIINISTIDSLRQKVKELRKTTQEDIDRKIHASDSKTKDLQIFLLALNQKMEDLQEVKKQLSLYNQKRRTENEILKAMMSDMMRQKEDMENQQLELCAVLQDVVKEKTELRQERLQLNTVREVTNRNWLDLKNTTAAIEKEMLSVQKNKQMLEKKQEVLGNKLIELRSNQDQISCFLDEANQARTNTQHLNLERKSLKEKLEKAMSAFAFGQKELCVKEGNIKRDREKLEREKCFLKTEMEKVAKLKEELNEKREDIEASKIKISIEKADLSQLEMEVKTEKERLLIQRKAVEESSNDLRMREDKCMENMESIQTLRMKVRHLNEKLRELTTVNIKKCQDNTDSVIKVIHVFVEKCEAMQEQCDLLTWKTIKESLSNALSNVFSQVEHRKDISQEDGNTDVQQGQSDMYLDSDILKREKASVELVSSNIQNLQRVRGFLEDTTTVLHSKKEQAVCLMKEIEDEILISKTRSLQVKKRTEGIERVMRRFTSDHRELILGGAESQSQTRELENSTILLHALQEEMNHLRDDFKVKIVHFKRTMKSIAQEKEKLTSLSAEICVERHKLERERTERERHQSELKTREEELIINISTIDSLRQKVKELRKTTQEDIDRKIHASDSKTKDLQIFLLALNQKMEDLQEVKKQLSLYNQKRRTENEILKAMMSDMMRQKEDMENQQLELCAILQHVVKEKTELRQERLQLNTVCEVTNRNWLDLKNTTAAIEKEMLSVQENKQMLEKKQEVLGNKLIELRSNQDQISCFLDEANQARTNTQHLNLERKSLKEKLEKAMSAFAFGQKELCVKEGNIKRDREKLEREKCFLKTEMEEVAKLKKELNEKREDIEASKIKISIEKADLSQLEMEVKTEKERLLIQRKAVEESSNDLRMREDKCMENMESIQTLRMKVRHLNERLRDLTTVNIKKCQDNTDSVIKVIHVFVEKCEAMQEQCDLLTWKTIKESLSNALSNVFSQVEQRKDISQEDGNTDVQQGQSDMYLDSDILKREKASVELVSSNIQNLQRVRGFLEDTTTVLQSKKEQAVCLMKEIEDEILISKTRSLQVKKRAEGIERVMRRFTSDHRELILGGAESQSQTRELENSTILLHALQEEMNHLRDDFKVKIVHFKRTMKSIAQEKEKLTSLSAEICVERHKLERERTERERHQSELKTREEELIINISTIDSLRQKVKELRKTTQEDIDRKIHASDSKTKDLQTFLLALNQKMEDLQEVKKQLSLYNQKRRTENEILKAMMSDMMRQKKDMENQQLELCAVLQDVVKEKTELRQERLQLNTVREVTNRNWLDLKNTTAAIEKEMLSMQENKQMFRKKLGHGEYELPIDEGKISILLNDIDRQREIPTRIVSKAISDSVPINKKQDINNEYVKRGGQKKTNARLFLLIKKDESEILKKAVREKREVEASIITERQNVSSQRFADQSIQTNFDNDVHDGHLWKNIERTQSHESGRDMTLETKVSHLQGEHSQKNDPLKAEDEHGQKVLLFGNQLTSPRDVYQKLWTDANDERKKLHHLKYQSNQIKFNLEIKQKLINQFVKRIQFPSATIHAEKQVYTLLNDSQPQTGKLTIFQELQELKVRMVNEIEKLHKNYKKLQ